MLRWRLLLGTLIIAALVGLGWLDHRAATPGVWLLPAAIAFIVLASGEILDLLGAVGTQPLAWVVYAGNLVILASNWFPAAPAAPGRWTLPVFALAVLAAFVGEMVRYRQPGRVMANLAATILALVYVGVLLSFAVQLRLMWGVGAMASLVIVVKMADTGAYTVGRLIGRHKMAPVLSPGKTWEGFLGGLAFAAVGAYAALAWLVPLMSGPRHGQPWWSWLVFGLVVGMAGMLGDLAESLLKRDAGRKDSSRWLPGFGGVLDIIDSILLAAPVAWLWWATM